ncbi:MAG: hypothetical protein AB1412_09925 [Pseudomonadota bacterium]
MALCATLFQGIAIWAGLPATLFALMLLLGYRLNTRFTWTLLLLGIAGLSTWAIAKACTVWGQSATQASVWLGLAWLALALVVIAACAVALWRIALPRDHKG